MSKQYYQCCHIETEWATGRERWTAWLVPGVKAASHQEAAEIYARQISEIDDHCITVQTRYALRPRTFTVRLEWKAEEKTQ